jgi:HEAT repeat protein
MGKVAEAAIPALTKALEDENSHVREAAAESLKKISTR